MAQLQPRREVWEYGVLPLSTLCPLLDAATLQLAHSKLLTRSSAAENGNRVVSLPEISSTLDLTSTQTEVLVEVLSALSLANLPADDQPGAEQVHVHELSMFLFAQLFSREAQRPDSVECWPEAGPGPSGMGADLLSPTRQLARNTSGKAMLRQQLQQHLRNQHNALRGFGDYLRRNLRLILELAQDPSSPDPTRISAREVDRVGFLLLPPRQRQVASISSLVPAFITQQTLSLDQAVSNLKQSWFEETLDSPRLATFSTNSSPSPKAHRSLGLVGSGLVEEQRISGVHKGTVVRGELDFPSGQLHITDCHDTIVYILAPLQYVYISACSDCTIVVGAVGKVVRVERCDKVQVIAAAARVVIASCHDCVFHLGVLRAPILIGDSRFLKFAPFNTRYERQLAHLRDAGVRLDMPNQWDSPIVLQGRDRRGQLSGPDSPRAYSLSSSTKPPFSLLPPEEFFPFVVPFQGSAGVLAGGVAPSHTTKWGQLHTAASKGPVYLFPLPPEYERALHKKLGMTSELRHKFKQANLGKDKERELNDAIQAHFKDWLASSNMLRQIYDLSNLEKDEVTGTPLTAGNSAGAAAPPSNAGGVSASRFMDQSPRS